MDYNHSLEGRVNAFNRLELPCQPKFVHIGTSHLIRDLWSEVQRLRFLNDNNRGFATHKKEQAAHAFRFALID